MAIGDDTLLAAAVEEYHLQPQFQTLEEAVGRRSAIRGLMVRLGLYNDFLNDVKQREINHKIRGRKEKLDNKADS